MYKLSIQVSGSGQIIDAGTAETLEGAAQLCTKLDKMWELWAADNFGTLTPGSADLGVNDLTSWLIKLVQNWEGCDFCAESEDGTIQLYVGDESFVEGEKTNNGWEEL